MAGTLWHATYNKFTRGGHGDGTPNPWQLFEADAVVLLCLPDLDIVNAGGQLHAINCNSKESVELGVTTAFEMLECNIKLRK